MKIINANPRYFNMDSTMDVRRRGKVPFGVSVLIIGGTSLALWGLIGAVAWVVIKVF